MGRIITKSVLGKFLLLMGLIMPLLIILEVLPTIKAVIYVALVISCGSIYCWGLKGGIISALYSSLLTLGLFPLS